MQVALVTGASRGIGAAIAKQLATPKEQGGLGMAVIINYVSDSSRGPA